MSDVSSQSDSDRAADEHHTLPFIGHMPCMVGCNQYDT